MVYCHHMPHGLGFSCADRQPQRQPTAMFQTYPATRRRLFAPLLVLHCCLSWLASSNDSIAHATDVTLLQDGAVHATVVIADQPSELERHAAQLLCRYLSRMAGNVPPPAPIHTGEWQHAAGSSAILVGSLDAHAGIRSLVAGNRLSLSSRDPGGDGLVIQTVEVNRQHLLILTGSSRRSVLHAVVHFLEHYGKVGVFWDGERVPRRDHWRVGDLAIRQKPHFPVRQYLQGCAFSYSYMVWWDLAQRKRHLDWAAFKKQSRLMWPAAGKPAGNSTGTLDNFLHQASAASFDYGRRQLGLEFISREDRLINRDPFPEQRVSPNPAEENRIIKRFVEETLAEARKLGPDTTWYTSGWALFNPGWRTDTAKIFFDAIGDAPFYICDIWADVHPIYKKYDYFYGKDWGFGVLHSFGGSTTLHGDVAGLIRRTQAVAADPKAERCIAFYINPEVLFYNDFYFDLAAQLSWRPQDVRLGSFIQNYAERRYGQVSAPTMETVFHELVASVYGTDDRSGPFWQGRVSNEFSSTATNRSTYIPHLEKALELALTEADHQRDNPLYGKDLVDIAKQLVAEVANGHLFRCYNAYAWKDEAAFDQSATALRLCLDLVDRLLASRPEYAIGPVLDRIADYPGMTPQRQQEVERYFKDEVMTFALRENLRDYNRRDLLETYRVYYRPRAEAFLDYLETKFAARDFAFDPDALTPAYAAIERRWMASPLPRFTTPHRSGDDVRAVRHTLSRVRQISRAVQLDARTQLTNGGFESGRPRGWRIANQNMDVSIASDFKSFSGFGGENLYALHFRADKADRYKTFSAQQKLQWHPQSRVSLDYLIQHCSNYANAYLKLNGTAKDGKTGVQVLYFWGGDSWDHKNATPQQTGTMYTVARQLSSPANKWQRLECVPAADFDQVHGSGKWQALGIQSVTVSLGAWVLERSQNHIEGWIDELKVTQPLK